MFYVFLIFLSCDEPTVILDTLADWRFAKNVRENIASACMSPIVDTRLAICDRESPHSILCGCTAADPGRIQYWQVMHANVLPQLADGR